MGTGLYPRALCLVQCGRWAYPIVWTVVALLDGGLRFFFCFCLSVFREWMGRACGVVVRKFVFRIVDGTGMFSVSS